MVAISLLYRKGFFTQVLSDDGVQTEEPVEWRVEDFLKRRKKPRHRSARKTVA